MEAAKDEIDDDEAPAVGALHSLLKTYLNADKTAEHTKQGRASMKKPGFSTGIFKKWLVKEAQGAKGVHASVVEGIRNAVEDGKGFLRTVHDHGKRDVEIDSSKIGFTSRNVFHGKGNVSPSEASVEDLLHKSKKKIHAFLKEDTIKAQPLSGEMSNQLKSWDGK